MDLPRAGVELKEKARCWRAENMGLGLREQEEGSPPRRSRGMLWGAGMVAGRLRAFTVVQNGAGGAILSMEG